MIVHWLAGWYIGDRSVRSCSGRSRAGKAEASQRDLNENSPILTRSTAPEGGNEVTKYASPQHCFLLAGALELKLSLFEQDEPLRSRRLRFTRNPLDLGRANRSGG